MTQPTEAVGGEPLADSSPIDPFMELAGEMLGEQEDEPAEAAEEEALEAEAEEVAEDDPELEAEDDDLPPIEAPVSWDAEAKEQFKALPRELQETVTKREAERERFVQAKSQEAAQAQKSAVQQATSELAQIERHYAAQYQQVAQQLDVPQPDYALLATDPAEFARQAQLAQHISAQREAAQRTAEQYAQQAAEREAQAEQAYHAEQHQKIVEHFPEYADPTTGPKLQQELTAVARDLGYSPELISQARADDILAMKTAAEWKAKAAKYDALQGKKMERVRAAKGLPKVATPGVAVSQDATRAARANAAWEATKNSKGQARDDAFASYLKTQGIL